jgi:tetratricopeptide (TPR) repeat protein
MRSDFPPQSGGPRRIDSWKEIAAFFGRDERTVKRWEKERGLPVHRIPGGSRGSVFVFAEELTAWLEASEAGQQADPRRSDAPQASEPSAGGRTEPQPLGAAWVAPLPRKHPLGNQVRWMIAVLAALVVVGFAGGFRLLRVAAARLYPRPEANSRAAAREAEDLYLQGRFYWNTRTPEGLTKSVDYFTKATQLDPAYAPAYAGLADSYNLLREYTSMPGSQAFPLALAAAKKALELDASLPEAHRALAFADFNWNWDIPGAEREYRRAIDLRPADAQAHHWYATMLLELARHDESIAQIERARQLDPSSKSIAADRGFIFYYAGRTDEAFAVLRALEKAEPSYTSPHAYLATMYFTQKQYENYFAESRTLATLSSDDAALARLNSNEVRFQQGGERALLDAILAQQLDDFQQGRGGAFDIAATYANLGRKKESLAYLERAYQRHEYVFISVRNNPAFKSLAPDPEYQDLLKRAGLAAVAST